MKPTKKEETLQAAPAKKADKASKPASAKPAAKKAAPVVKPKPAAKKPAAKKTTSSGAPISHGVGRRKRSVARVWLRRGKGVVTVNGKAADVHFDTDFNRAQVALPLTVLPTGVTYDVDVNVQGGGTSTQAAAVKLGIARALLASDESMRPKLRKHRLLSVDSRVKERKKYGQRGARRKFQFVKR